VVTSPDAVTAMLDIPDRENSEDPAVLAAWYGPFGWADHLRKVTLANCSEMIRAQYALADLKLSEARLDALSRVHPAYLKFLAVHLEGRILWEREVIKRGMGG